MSKNQSLQRILPRAKEREKKYDWLGAVEFYKKAPDLVVNQRDFLKAAEIQKRLGHCFHRAAFQAETNEEFQLCLGKAHGAYFEAAKHYLKVGDKLSDVLAKHCEAMAKYTALQLSKDPTERRSLLDQCIELEEQSLNGSKEMGESTLLPDILRNLLHLLNNRVGLEASPKERKQLLEKALMYGEDVEKLSPFMDSEVLADCLIYMAYHYVMVTSIFPEDQVQDLSRKAVECCRRAVELAETSENKELLAEVTYTDVMVRIEWGSETALAELERVAALANQTGNKQSLAMAYTILARDLTFGKFQRESDPKRLRSVVQKVEDLATQALRLFKITGNEAGASQVYGHTLSILYLFIARDLENTYDKIIEAHEKAVEYNNRALQLADKSGNIWANFYALVNAPIFRYHLIKVTKDPEERLNLLRETSKLGKRAVDFFKNLFPNTGQLGTVLAFHAAVKAELAVLGENIEEKTEVLKETADLCESGVEIWAKHAGSITAIGLLGRTYEPLLRILSQVFEITGDERYGRRLLSALGASIEVYEKIGKTPQVAESLWRYAFTLDRLGEYYEAVDYFSKTRDKFNSIAKEFPLLEMHFKDYAIYMEAWSEIAGAKQAHEEFLYGKASKLYDNASRILATSTKWNALKDYYIAYSSLERGEEHSKSLKIIEAISDFQRAIQQFTNANEQLRSLQEKEETVRIEEEISQLIKLSLDMKTYSQGRTKYEQARLSDLKDEKRKSSALYKSARKIFAELAARAKDELIRKDTAATALLCQAWSQMKKAEYAKSPEGYDEAVKLFQKAGEQAEGGKSKTLAMANASLCKALELLTRYNENLESNLFASSKQLLEQAERQYLEAGFEQIANWVRATQRLMDARIFLGKAEAEVEEEKKTRHYHLAEKNFELAARLYGSAGYELEKEHTLKQLKRTREEKEILTTPLEVAVGPQLPSDAPDISSFYLHRERPVGLEHFEHAEIQSSTTCDSPEVIIAEDFTLEIEMVNAGKNPVFLIKIMGIVMEGLELRKTPVPYSLKKTHLDMKGRRLDPLKTEELKLTYRSLKKGTYTLKLRIRYLEASGKYHLHKSRSVTIKVQELGISGWLKGPR